MIAVRLSLDYNTEREIRPFFLGLNSSQLVHPTKARAKAPRTHRPRKNRLSNERKQSKTEQTIGVEATRPSFRGKTPLGDTRQAGPGRPHTIRDSSRESTSASCTKDQVTNLIARFEQIWDWTSLHDKIHEKHFISGTKYRAVFILQFNTSDFVKHVKKHEFSVQFCLCCSK